MNDAAKPTLGMLLRHVTELLDGDLEQIYRDAGLDYRPRYTPVVRALIQLGPSPIRDIARYGSMSHSAASQTVSQMVRKGLLRAVPGTDARERVIRMTPKLRRMLPALRSQWAATNAAADRLCDELPYPLHLAVTAAIEALERRPFRERIASSRTSHEKRRVARRR